jgi:hypothetical protein
MNTQDQSKIGVTGLPSEIRFEDAQSAASVLTPHEH